MLSEHLLLVNFKNNLFVWGPNGWIKMIEQAFQNEFFKHTRGYVVHFLDHEAESLCGCTWDCFLSKCVLQWKRCYKVYELQRLYRVSEGIAHCQHDTFGNVWPKPGVHIIACVLRRSSKYRHSSCIAAMQRQICGQSTRLLVCHFTVMSHNYFVVGALEVSLEGRNVVMFLDPFHCTAHRTCFRILNYVEIWKVWRSLKSKVWWVQGRIVKSVRSLVVVIRQNLGEIQFKLQLEPITTCRSKSKLSPKYNKPQVAWKKKR